jgi:hypothetical protein
MLCKIVQVIYLALSEVMYLTTLTGACDLLQNYLKMIAQILTFALTSIPSLVYLTFSLAG